MPIYEYQCKENGHKFEVIQKFSDAPLKKCRLCDSPVVKLISASSFVLKGSGFYVNDYAKKDSGGSDKKKSKDVSKDSANEGKSESKTETKSETAGGDSGKTASSASTSPKTTAAA